MTGRILFVDDEPRVTTAVARMLRGTPYEILTANSARGALDVLETSDVDVIVSDERMPEMSGCELLAVARRRFPEAVRIILTGDASLDAAIEAINEAEIYRFLTKPCSPDDLQKCLESALAARSERRRQPVAPTVDPALARGLDDAMDHFWMAYQPIVTADGTQLFGYEALVRCDRPGFADPPSLLGAAERLGRLPELDHRIFQRVAGDLGDGPDGALAFVNVHPRTLDDAELFLEHNPLLPYAERVVFEITERSSLEQVVGVQEKIEALRELGFRVAVDDLGAGYAGLTSLALLRPEFVKIDKSLTAEIEGSHTSAKLVGSLASACRELGLRVLAEGVERAGQRDQLVALGCELLQGYLYGRPGKGFSAPIVPPA